MLAQKTKLAIHNALRLIGAKVVRWAPGYEIAYFPLEGKELTPTDFVIRSMLAERGDFYFVQIGANDGKRHDPIRRMVLKHQLRGLLVEPLPDLFQALKQNYASQTQLSFENAAISNHPGELSLFRFRPDAPVPDYVHGMATLNANKIRTMAREGNLDNFVEEVKVRGMTFQQLLEKHQVGAISLLQIDTEGFDFEVIKMALGSGTLPEAISYEFVNLSPGDRLASCKLLSEFGYRLLHSRIDTLAVRERLLDDMFGRG
jgi:FkbM family methyltransferase